MSLNHSSPKFMVWVASRLRKRFGAKVKRREKDLVQVLVKTVLSQNTNDLNRDRAYTNLQRQFPHTQDLLNAATGKIARTIRVAGLNRQKAVRLKAILHQIKIERGKLNLSFLCQMTREEARRYLLRFKGVGEKTAAVVLLFGCGMPAFPVDTHILRVSKRLGILPGKTTAEKAHQMLGAMVPDSLCYELHLNLISLGRTICRARKPDCPRCPLNTRCRYCLTARKKL